MFTEYGLVQLSQDDYYNVLTVFLLVADESNGSKGTKASPNGVSRWKSILKNIVEQVSQVDSPLFFCFVGFVRTFPHYGIVFLRFLFAGTYLFVNTSFFSPRDTACTHEAASF